MGGWLRRDDGEEVACLLEFATVKRLDVAASRIQCDNCIVTLVRVPAQLAASLDVLHDVAEVRKAKETSTAFVDMGVVEQRDWVKELVGRTTPAPENARAVCIFDTGVNRTTRCSRPRSMPQVATPAIILRRHDHDGHGTETAGLTLYGDLTPVLAASLPHTLRHCLESVKILPPNRQNRPDLYGAIAAERRVALRCRPRHGGAASRWRSLRRTNAIEARPPLGPPPSMRSRRGRAFDVGSRGLVYIDDGNDAAHGLFLLCAGNVEATRLPRKHLDASDADPIHDPRRAWNVLTGRRLHRQSIHHRFAVVEGSPLPGPATSRRGARRVSRSPRLRPSS